MDFVQSTKFCLGLGSRSIKIQSRNYHKLHWSAFLFLAVPTHAPVFFPRVQWRPSCIAERAQLFQLAAPLSLQLCYTVIHFFLVWTSGRKYLYRCKIRPKIPAHGSRWGGGNKKIKLYIIKQWIIHYKTMTEKKIFVHISIHLYVHTTQFRTYTFNVYIKYIIHIYRNRGSFKVYCFIILLFGQLQLECLRLGNHSGVSFKGTVKLTL